MDLTDADVTDILALLDSLPYDELDLETSRFRLTLRRTPHGWTQSTQVLSAPAPVSPVSPAPPTPLTPAAPAAVPTAPAAVPTAPAAVPTAPAAAGSMEHRTGHSRLDGTSSRPEGDGDEAGGALVAVRAPLPGTFYRAPRPGAAPFVEVGSQVSADTVIGIVETMKLMNSVHAGVPGTVAEFCVQNAEFAAHGATLLRIRADQ
jgi:acetyl-CoA carboxylase biotin carboxyl carrier protein